MRMIYQYVEKIRNDVYRYYTANLYREDYRIFEQKKNEGLIKNKKKVYEEHVVSKYDAKSLPYIDVSSYFSHLSSAHNYYGRSDKKIGGERGIQKKYGDSKVSKSYGMISIFSKKNSVQSDDLSRDRTR